jgi:peptidoglycan/xylan/chitin deacetylase (PgdA/CDA1 family)
VLVTFDDCTVDLLDTAAPLLREAGIPAVAFAVTRLLGGTNEWSRKEAPRLRLLDRDGLHRLAESGIAVGSHTQTHRRLPGLDAGDLEREVVGSADDLAELGLGRPALIAYPHGEHDAAARAVSRDAGYVAGLAVQLGIACREDDRFALPRIEILRDDAGWRFLLKVARAGR